MDFNHSARTKEYLQKLKQFMKTEIEPIEHQYMQEMLAANNGGDWTKWSVPSIIEELKEKASTRTLEFVYSRKRIWRSGNV